MSKYLLLASSCVVIALTALFVAQSRPPASTRGLEPAVYSGAAARPNARGARPGGEGDIYAPGRVEGATREIELRSTIAGRIVELSVVPGQFVSRDDALLRVDDAQHRCEVDLAAAQLAEAQSQLERLEHGARDEERREAVALHQAQLAQLEQAQLAWKRVEKLYRDGAAAAQQFDDQRTTVASLQSAVAAAKARADLLNAPPRVEDVQMAKARVAAFQARLAIAQDALGRTALRAPVGGRILDVQVEPGELIGPESNDAAVVMADTSRYRVRAFVEELDAPTITVGRSARVTAEGLPGHVYTGQVTCVSPRMSTKTRFTDQPGERVDTKTREVWVELDTTDELVIGLRVDVLFTR